MASIKTRVPILGTRAVFVRVAVTVKRHHAHSDSYKGKHLIGNGLQFRGLALIVMAGSTKASMVLER